MAKFHHILSCGFSDCGSPANATAMPSMSGSSGATEGFCVPNGNAAIKFLGFKEVSVQ